MKKIIAIGLLLGILGAGTPAMAQEDTKKKSTVSKAKSGVKKAWKGTKKGAKAVGNETAEKSTTLKSKVTDKKSAVWVGPDGQTIYVDDGQKYYWINEKGGRVFVSRDQLKPKKQEE